MRGREGGKNTQLGESEEREEVQGDEWRAGSLFLSFSPDLNAVFVSIKRS